ncbi:MAG: MEDS domain-containing protein [Dehalococcoidia bacterium]
MLRDKEAPNRVYFGLPNVYVDTVSHIAHFYEGGAERLNVATPFLKTGLENGDQCVIFAESAVARDIDDRLREMGVDINAAVSSGQLIYWDRGPDVEELPARGEAIHSAARNSGRELVRVACDMSWALGRMRSVEELLEYEAYVDNHVMNQSNHVVLCQYDNTLFGGSAVMCSLHTHALSIMHNIVQNNPFYRDPNEVLQDLEQIGGSRLLNTPLAGIAIR